MTTAPTPGWTGHVAVDSALVMLDRIDCSPDDDARIDAITSTLRQLHATYQALQTENERLRMELVAEARAAAEQKLRADQLAQQHRMQAQMHAQATQQLAELEARKPLPLSDDDRLRLRSDVARAIWDVMREHEDRCDHALEDVEPKHQVWDCADAAIKAVHGITGGSS